MDEKVSRAGEYGRRRPVGVKASVNASYTREISHDLKKTQDDICDLTGGAWKLVTSVRDVLVDLIDRRCLRQDSHEPFYAEERDHTSKAGFPERQVTMRLPRDHRSVASPCGECATISLCTC